MALKRKELLTDQGTHDTERACQYRSDTPGPTGEPAADASANSAARIAADFPDLLTSTPTPALPPQPWTQGYAHVRKTPLEWARDPIEAAIRHGLKDMARTMHRRGNTPC